VTEDTDAVAVVVSEETGLLSFVQKGEIRRGLDPPKLRAAIFEALGVVRKEKEKDQKVSEANSESEEIASV
jgi:diadenylate cyclase